MVLEAYATVNDVTEAEVARANERLREFLDASELDDFTFWRSPDDPFRTSAWVAFHEPLFWPPDQLDGDWPAILRRLDAVQASWPGMTVWYHGDHDEPGDGTDDPFGALLVETMWEEWWDGALFAQQFYVPVQSCAHDALRVEVQRTELNPSWGQGTVSFKVRVRCSCGLEIGTPVRAQHDVADIERVVTRAPGRKAFVAVAADRRTSLTDCAKAAMVAIA